MDICITGVGGGDVWITAMQNGTVKIKGKNNLKVEVNPIKTLTPRFIQRFLKIFKE